MLALWRKLKARRALEAGDAARDVRDWQAAALAYRRYLGTVPDDAGIWVQLGHALKESGAIAEAETAYRAALDVRADDVDACLHLSHLLRASGRQDEASAFCRDAADRAPASHPDAQAEIQRALGDAARDSGEWGRAADAYSAYLEIVPGDGGIWAQLGHALREGGQFEKAHEAYRKAIACSPESADAWFFHGLTLKVLGRWTEAQAAVSRAVELDPADNRAREELKAITSSPRSSRTDAARREGAGMARDDEQRLLIQSQSRALRALATELVKLRSEIEAFSSRLAQVDQQAAERDEFFVAEIGRLRAELSDMRQSGLSDPLAPLQDHLRERLDAKR